MKTLRLFTLMILTMGLLLGSCSSDDNGTTTPPVTDDDNGTTTPPVTENSAPEITNQTTTASVGEDADGSATIFTVTASDEDDDSLTFAISSNSGGLFAINADGNVTLAEGQALDFETTAKHTITVTVSDGNGGTDTIDITIAVTDVAIPPNIGTAEFTVAEDATEIGNLSATGEEGNALSYEITLNDNELFTIGDTGTIALGEGQSLDFETETAHTITVSVSDGEQVTEQEIQINVENIIENLFEDPEAFIIKIDTEFDGTFSFNVFAGVDEPIDLRVDRGDGNDEVLITSEGLQNYDYEIGPEYLVAFKGEVGRISFNGDGTLRTVEQWGEGEGAIAWDSMEGMFRNNFNFEGFAEGAGVPVLSECTSTFEMFRNTLNFNSPMGDWDMGNVTNMGGMFRDAPNFNQPIGNWNVESVIDMGSMFSGATSFDQDLSIWIPVSAINMTSMFAAATSFDQNISDWNTENVIFMGGMFAGATSFNQDISEWSTSNVTSMKRMFLNATAFSQDLGSWDIGAIGSDEGDSANDQAMRFMFDGSGMSPEDYASTLIGWNDDEDGAQTIPFQITLGAVDIDFCDAASAARNNLIDLFGSFWTITDGDPVDCPDFNP
nr:BspA family leucine-rich repeat surface protein [uncultured Allomuricauda sp.]